MLYVWEIEIELDKKNTPKTLDEHVNVVSMYIF